MMTLVNRGRWILIGLLALLPVTIANAADRMDTVRGCRGTYAAPPIGKDGRVDIPELIKELVDQHANTYVWTMRAKLTDWSDLKLFLPEARSHGINVWAGIYPPSEQPPSEPFKYDLNQWAVELAKISLDQPNLVAWSMDDFSHNLKTFTPDLMKTALAAGRKINPQLLFMPCCYYKEIVDYPNFFDAYKDGLDGVLFPYRHDSGGQNLTDPSLATPELKKLKDMAGPSVPIILDVYATRHSRLGPTTPDYVRQVMEQGKQFADGVMIYRHQSPETQPEKYQIIKELFTNWSANLPAAPAQTRQSE